MTSAQPHSIIIVWFKRDLRLQDHAPLHFALQSGKPILPLYLFEPEIMADPHYSDRHWRFVWQSLLAMQKSFSQIGAQLHVSYDNAIPFFEQLLLHYPKITVASYQEIGLDCTYRRDKHLKSLFKQRGVIWQEFPYGGVTRGLSNRKNWLADWHNVMTQPLIHNDLNKGNWLVNKSVLRRVPADISSRLHQADVTKQTGGEHQAHHLLNSFLTERHQQYHRHISSPLASFNSCSRLSPYLAWGNISVRQVFQALSSHQGKLPDSLKAFASRLHWHCHFIQKFESECTQENRPVNRAYENFPFQCGESTEYLLTAWQQGNTGIPMIDACMRCVNQTGYLNFRMRAMLVSFLSHYLLIDWRRGVHHLARQFVDFEPGIHYPQFQMQAGVTGTNTLRIYNPVKQAQDNDPTGEFIRTWIPELAHLPIQDLHAPWQMPPLTRMALEKPVPDIYLYPVICPEDAIAKNRKLLWEWRERDDVKKEAKRLLIRHSMPV